VHRLSEALGNMPRIVCNRLDCVREILEAVTDVLTAHNVSEEARIDIKLNVTTNSPGFRDKIRNLKLTSTLVQALAKKLSSSKDANGADTQVEAWGWAGVTINANVQARIAAMLTTAARVLRQIAEFLDARVKRWLMEEHQDKVLENQEKLLATEEGG
jgi:hypothetical protein